MIDINQQCKGVWDQVLVAIGMDRELFNGKYHDCIYCGRKKKSRWQRKQQRMVCVCATRQPIVLAMDSLSSDFKSTANYIRQNALGGYMQPTVIPDDRAKNRKDAEEIHKGLKRITSDTPAGKYLLSRRVKNLPQHNLYAHPSLDYWYKDDADKWQSKQFAGMVAIIRDKAGNAIGMQRYFLTDEGRPAKLKSPKKNLVFGEMKQSGVYLSNEYGDTIAISEGVVNGLLFQEHEGIPAYAAIDANGMRDYVVPEGIKHVYIIEDYDISFTGRAAAGVLANRLLNESKQTLDVAIASFRVTELGIKMDIIRPKINIDYADYVATI